jgi:hypothetical protein
MLACRLCRVPLAATSGCAACDPVRRNLVVVGEDESDRPSLAGTAGELVKSLNTQAKHLKQRLEQNPDDQGAENRMLKCANTAAKVLESARKLQVDGVAAVENMAFAERAELFITWLTHLPPAYRSALKDRWDAWELETSKPLQLEAGN